MSPIEIRPLAASPEIVAALSDLLIETVAHGGSVSFMHPLAPEAARTVLAGRAGGGGAGRADRARRLRRRGALVGTVSLLLDCPPNQPHRAEIAKMMTRVRATAGAGSPRRCCAQAEALAAAKAARC